MRKWNLLASVGCVLALASGLTQAQSTYRLSEIGTFGGILTDAKALNDAGQVTGFSYTAGNATLRAFLWEDGAMADLGTLGGDASAGMALNDAGQVTGYSLTVGNATSHAFLWDGSAMVDLGTLDGSPNSSATDINDAGLVTGDSAGHAFLWDGSAMVDLGTLGGTSSAGSSLNGAGQVTGRSDAANDIAWHAFLWDGSLMVDLGTLPGDQYSQGEAINDAGQVMGQSDPSIFVAGDAFLWDGSAMVDLTLGGTVSQGHALNEAGHVTGQSNTANDAASHAFLWDGTAMVDLGTLGGAASSGEALNEAGQVIRSARTAGGVLHAFLWEAGVMHDLNELIDPTDPLQPYVTLWQGTEINESGQILAEGLDSRTNTDHWYLASPIVSAYAFDGFFQPVDNLPTRNVAKAGSGIPVKFSLNGDQGLEIFDSGYPVSQPISCDDSTPTDAVTETVTAGTSSLSYERINGSVHICLEDEQGVGWHVPATDRQVERSHGSCGEFSVPLRASAISQEADIAKSIANPPWDPGPAPGFLFPDCCFFTCQNR